MDHELSDDDIRVLLAEVQRFCHKSIEPLGERPDGVIAAGQLTQLTGLASQFGLLNLGAEPGAGLWEGTGGVGWLKFSSAALRQIARSNAGVAFHFHQLALGAYVRRRLGLDVGEPSVVCLQGRFGLARCSLARLLKRQPLDADDLALLQDFFLAAEVAEPKPWLFQAGDDWRQLLVPCLDREGRLGWSVLARQDLPLTPLLHSHGLDETVTWQWQPTESMSRLIPAAAERALAVYAEAFQLNAQALVAIACGAVRRGYERAREYAALRRQGGAPIGRHAAVRQMLARTASVLRIVELSCQQVACSPVGFSHLGAVVAARAEAHHLLCTAANESLQTLGGAGYTRDAGLEKVVRDCNHLRLLCGTPDELLMFLSEWEGDAPAGTVGVESGTSSAGCGVPLASAPSPRQSLAGHVAADHPLSPRQAFRCFPPLTSRIVSYEPAWIWDQDTAALPPPLAELRRRTREFAERELRPRALECDLHPHDPEADSAVVRTAAAAGVLFSHLPPPLGTGHVALADYPLPWAAAVKVEELCAACGGWGLMLAAHALGLLPLLLSGDKRAWKRFLIPANQRTQAGRPCLFAFAITEPNAGSDVEAGYGASRYRPATVARRAEGGWVLNGRKQYISGGDIADAVTVFAALAGEGLASWTCFLVERGAPGFRCLRNERKMGQRASGAAELELHDVFVPDDHVIGGLRTGWALNRATLTCSRLPVAAIALGIARGAMDAAIDFVCRFHCGGPPLIDRQEVQLRVADMIAETSAMRSMIWQHASRLPVTQANAAMSKFRCSEAAVRVCETALELLSQHGVLHRNYVEKHFRDVRLTPIYEGTNQINRLAVIEDFQEHLLNP
ncbi:MAG: hypothetical protein GX575_04940 [Candidatus Anammoximicrobium sp.]|nr:hypothetical protein [Candidatus Anammoximicrobium sp.]